MTFDKIQHYNSPATKDQSCCSSENTPSLVRRVYLSGSQAKIIYERQTTT